jgi:phosphohistidine phosphatase
MITSNETGPYQFLTEADMRRLLIFRHAKAERAEAGKSDRERALNERGGKDASRIGAYMAGHSLHPDRVVISPSLRTQETWKYARTAFRPQPAAQTIDRLYDAMPQAIFDVLKDTPASAHSLLVIGHNPGLHELALMLIASGDTEARERLREKLPTCGLAIIDFPVDDWSKLHPRSGRLERFVTPRSLEASPS